ncbi:hypothetical protein M378DRAFT_950622 [Amanita muscaria Koide BX008]|uniref:Uncharacterized protein n=1 Tax=Amanita muscaria (strain Koide BX008) TaxID=946122 RepID=A0A0C2WU56_AMAMK|nr:hypothetical protein M378DRAFT_950622 [Amanita muscaria Koide BX008]
MEIEYTYDNGSTKRAPSAFAIPTNMVLRNVSRSHLQFGQDMIIAAAHSRNIPRYKVGW